MEEIPGQGLYVLEERRSPVERLSHEQEAAVKSVTKEKRLVTVPSVSMMASSIQLTHSASSLLQPSSAVMNSGGSESA